MWKLIFSYQISRRLVIAFVLAAIVPSAIIATMGFYYFNQVNSREAALAAISQTVFDTTAVSRDIQDGYAQTKDLDAQILASLETHSNTSTVLGTKTDSINQDTNNLTAGLTNYRKQDDPPNSQFMSPAIATFNSVAPTNNSAVNDSNLLHTIIEEAWPQYSSAQTAELNLLHQVPGNVARGRVSAAKAATQITQTTATLDTAYTTLNTDWQQMISYVTTINQVVTSAGATQSQSVILLAFLAFVLSMAVVYFAYFIVQRSITSPLNELVSLTKRISKGETTARARVDGRDEIAIVANSMNSMLDNIVHLIQDTQSQRDVLQGQVEKLVSEVSGVGEGDLRVQAEVTADALGVLADSFNYMVEELGSLVVRVKGVAREVGESTSFTSDRMNELVEVADRQIQQISTAAVEIERMAQTGQQVASRAQALTASAREARLSAQGGRQAVRQTVEGMERIQINVQETSNRVHVLGERSREINNIVEAISTISHQTNRLALDAAIQAAMAGDNGKGFGAVAADIRRLAERAKEQASMVGQIIRSVRDDIGAVAVSMRDTERETSVGARLAGEAGTSLESIFAVIERQAREIDVISQMAVQQQQSSSDVVQIMQVVVASTQGSSASTREAAQNMERVARLAEQLLGSVEAFKLRDGMNYLAPNVHAPFLNGEQSEPVPTPGGPFRTVTATTQAMRPAFKAEGYASLPVGGRSAANLTQFSPVLSPDGNGRRQFMPPPAEDRQGLPFRDMNNVPDVPNWSDPSGWQSTGKRR